MEEPLRGTDMLFITSSGSESEDELVVGSVRARPRLRKRPRSTPPSCSATSSSTSLKHPRKLPPSSGSVLGSMAGLAGWMAQRAAAMVGMAARPSMNDTKADDEDERVRPKRALVKYQKYPDACGFSLMSIPRWLWIPSNMHMLEEAETQCYKHVKSSMKRQMVYTDDGLAISTITVKGANAPSGDINRPPLVLLHGFAGGAGIWCKSLDPLAADRTVYAIDMVGFGRSSRPVFSKDPFEAEELFVSSLESWRRAMSLTSFILAGHSMGGFVAGAYTMKHPSRVEHLVLIDCWGMPERQADTEPRVKLPGWVHVIGAVVNAFSPLSGLRAAGPMGAFMLRTLRPDMKKKYADMFDDNTIPNYLYHLNAQPPSGETAMKNMSIPLGWAKNPLLPRLLAHLDPDIPLTLFYGERSWVDCKAGYTLKEARPDSYVDVHIVPRAGHHVYSDQSGVFNDVMVEVCRRVTDHLTSSAEDYDGDTDE